MPSPLFTNPAPSGVQIANTQVPQIPTGLQVKPVDPTPAFEANRAMLQRAQLAEQKHQFDQGMFVKMAELRNKSLLNESSQRARSAKSVVDSGPFGLNVQYEKDAQLASKLTQTRDSAVEESTNAFVTSNGRPDFRAAVDVAERSSQRVAEAFENPEWRRETRLNNAYAQWEETILNARAKGLAVNESDEAAVRAQFEAYKNDLTGTVAFDPAMFNLQRSVYDPKAAEKSLADLGTAATALFETSEIVDGSLLTDAMKGSGVAMEQIREQSPTFNDAVARLTAGIQGDGDLVAAVADKGMTPEEFATRRVLALMGSQQVNRVKDNAEVTGAGAMARIQEEAELDRRLQELKTKGEPPRLAFDRITKPGDATGDVGAFDNDSYGIHPDYRSSVTDNKQLHERFNEGTYVDGEFIPKYPDFYDASGRQSMLSRVDIVQDETDGKWYTVAKTNAIYNSRGDLERPSLWVRFGEATAKNADNFSAPTLNAKGKVASKTPAPAGGFASGDPMATAMPANPNIRDLIMRAEGAYKWTKEPGATSMYDLSLDYGKWLPEGTSPPSTLRMSQIDQLQTDMINEQRRQYFETKALVDAGKLTWAEAKEKKMFTGWPTKDGVRPASSPLGPYQYTRTFLRGMKESHPQLFEGDPVFDADFQDRLFDEKLEELGLSKAINGTLPMDKFQDNISGYWASMPKFSTGKSTHGQATGATSSEFAQAFANTKLNPYDAKNVPPGADSVPPLKPMAPKQGENVAPYVAEVFNGAYKRIVETPQDAGPGDYLTALALGSIPAGATAQMSKETRDLVTEYGQALDIFENGETSSAAEVEEAAQTMREIEGRLDNSQATMGADINRAISAAVIPSKYYAQATESLIGEKVREALTAPGTSITLPIQGADIDGDGSPNKGEVKISRNSTGYVVDVKDTPVKGWFSFSIPGLTKAPPKPSTITNASNLKTLDEVMSLIGENAGNATLDKAMELYAADKAKASQPEVPEAGDPALPGTPTEPTVTNAPLPPSPVQSALSSLYGEPEPAAPETPETVATAPGLDPEVITRLADEAAEADDLFEFLFNLDDSSPEQRTAIQNELQNRGINIRDRILGQPAVATPGVGVDEAERIERLVTDVLGSPGTIKENLKRIDRSDLELVYEMLIARGVDLN